MLAIEANLFIPMGRVKSSVGEDGDEISCKILYDNKEVATHISKGTFATAVCENKFIDNILSSKTGKIPAGLQSPDSPKH